ncbi:hypothetical protein [Edaphobacter aggregans]|uniref:hypothetical protein n=1 Tax=Edaphobacter aggregans TaxID=570835 RepID=UPI00069090D0|nr:hypothetical protein [Edaphobacter aggregans]
MRIHPRLGRLAAPVLALLLATAALAQSRADVDKAIETNLGDPVKFHEAFTHLQQAVARHDAAAIAAMVSYPITINPHTNKAMRVRTPEAFAASYDKIITPHIAKVVKDQKYEQLFVNYQGAMFGSGEVWLAGICRDSACKQSEIRIITIQNTTDPTKK